MSRLDRVMPCDEAVARPTRAQRRPCPALLFRSSGDELGTNRQMVDTPVPGAEGAARVPDFQRRSSWPGAGDGTQALVLSAAARAKTRQRMHMDTPHPDTPVGVAQARARVPGPQGRCSWQTVAFELSGSHAS